MKKHLFWIIPLLLIAVWAWADVDTKDGTAITSDTNMDGFSSAIDDYDGQVVKAAAAGGYDCSNGLTFGWACEDADVTADSPTGCSDGDTTASLHGSGAISSSQYSDGDESLYANGWGDATFTVSSLDLITDTAGTITFDIYIVAFVDECQLLKAQYDNNNRIYFKMNGTDDATGREIGIVYYGNGSYVTAYTTAADLAEGTWYSATGKWRQGATDPSLYFEINSATASSDTNLIDMSNDMTSLAFGDIPGTGAEFYIDKIKIYDSWQ